MNTSTNLTDYLDTLQTLFDRNNNFTLEDDDTVDRLYMANALKHKETIERSSSIINKDKDNLHLAPHDGIIQGLRYTKQGHLIMTFSSFCYINKEEVGTQVVQLKLKPTSFHKFQAGKGDQICHLVCSDNQLGLLTFSGHRLIKDVIDFESIEVRHPGNLERYKREPKNSALEALGIEDSNMELALSSKPTTPMVSSETPSL